MAYDPSSMRRRDTWLLAVLLAVAVLALGWRAWGARPRPFDILKAPSSSPIPRIDLNRASLPEIQALPGVGPKLADAIVSARPIQGLEDLSQVRGIGPRLLERLEPRVRFGDSP